jgi:hypothetical protein
LCSDAFWLEQNEKSKGYCNWQCNLIDTETLNIAYLTGPKYHHYSTTDFIAAIASQPTQSATCIITLV